MTPKPEHLTLDELERIAYISGDTERAALYARLQDEALAQRAKGYEDGYTEGCDSAFYAD